MIFDIYLAHSVNEFRNQAEYVPLTFSIIAPIALIFGLLVRYSQPATWKYVGSVVGWASILVGLTGVILHLQSHFFYERTLRSLTYSAPFAAPLAYTGIGFLLILNRMVDSDTVEWAQWILFFALGGFAGNFVFSLADRISTCAPRSYCSKRASDCGVLCSTRKPISRVLPFMPSIISFMALRPWLRCCSRI